jgi:hypothetical protein
MSADSESTQIRNTSRQMYFIIIVYLSKKRPKMTLWVSQSASNSQPRIKMSVDSESTPENTSKLTHENISSFHIPSNRVVH